MSRFWRAFYGAALGAVLVLIIHPVSRPFLLTALSKRGSSKTFQNNPLILEGQQVLPVPNSLVDASLWMQEAALRIRQPQLVQAPEWDSFLKVASHAAQENADNAYWVQMQAVLTYAFSKTPNLSPSVKKGLRSLAISDWARASHLAKWDDYQTRRLQTIQTELANESGGSAAWQYAAVYPKRVTYSAQAIDVLARELLRNLGKSGKNDSQTIKNDLQLRYETLINGKLVREGARSIAIGEIGVSLVELASYPPGLPADPNPRALVLARTDFYNQLREAGMTQEALQANDAFKSNDGWLAFLRQENVGTEKDYLRDASLLTIDLPGAFLGIALVGGLLWLLATTLRLKPGLLKMIEVPYAPAIGFVLAIIFFMVTKLALASIAVFACFGFLAVTPANDRTRAPDQLGPAFEIVHFILGSVLVAFLVAFLVGLSRPDTKCCKRWRYLANTTADRRCS